LLKPLWGRGKKGTARGSGVEKNSGASCCPRIKLSSETCTLVRALGKLAILPLNIKGAIQVGGQGSGSGVKGRLKPPLWRGREWGGEDKFPGQRRRALTYTGKTGGDLGGVWNGGASTHKRGPNVETLMCVVSST